MAPSCQSFAYLFGHAQVDTRPFEFTVQKQDFYIQTDLSEPFHLLLHERANRRHGRCGVHIRDGQKFHTPAIFQPALRYFATKGGDNEVGMRITLERSGGVTGMRMTATLDTETMSPQEARDLEALVASARFFDLPATLASAPTRPDLFQYRLTLEIEGRRHIVNMAESAVPETFQTLLRRLVAAARSRL